MRETGLVSRERPQAPLLFLLDSRSARVVLPQDDPRRASSRRWSTCRSRLCRVTVLIAVGLIALVRLPLGSLAWRLSRPSAAVWRDGFTAAAAVAWRRPVLRSPRGSLCPLVLEWLSSPIVNPGGLMVVFSLDPQPLPHGFAPPPSSLPWLSLGAAFGGSGLLPSWQRGSWLVAAYSACGASAAAVTIIGWALPACLFGLWLPVFTAVWALACLYGTAPPGTQRPLLSFLWWQAQFGRFVIQGSWRPAVQFCLRLGRCRFGLWSRGTIALDAKPSDVPPA